MITAFKIYLISLVNPMFYVLSWGFFIFLFITLMLASINAKLDEDDKENAYVSAWIKKSLWISIVFGMLAFFIPSTKTLVTMYVIPRVVNNENMQKVPEIMVNFVNAYIDKNK